MHAIDKKSSEFDLKQETLSSLRLLLGAAFRADSPLRLRRARGVAGSRQQCHSPLHLAREALDGAVLSPRWP